MGQVRGNRPGGLKTRLRSVTHCSLGSATAGWHGQIESVGFLPASGMGHMELRHLRCFLAVAEELHFVRAVERRHIEQSPLSRAIKELEEDLGVRPFIHNSRSTRLSRAGQVFKGRYHASSPVCSRPAKGPRQLPPAVTATCALLLARHWRTSQPSSRSAPNHATRAWEARSERQRPRP